MNGGTEWRVRRLPSNVPGYLCIVLFVGAVVVIIHYLHFTNATCSDKQEWQFSWLRFLTVITMPRFVFTLFCSLFICVYVHF